VLRNIYIPFLIVILLSSCARVQAPKTAVNVPDEQVKTTELAPRVHFPTAKTKLVEEDLDVLLNNALWMHENPWAVLILEGHCDERGGDDYNMHLGDRRARSVKAALIENGVDEDSLTIVSYGERRPLDPKHNHKAWRENRRVEFVVR